MKKYKMLLILTTLTFFCFGILFYFISPRFGGRPSGERLDRCKQSPNYQKGQFVNREPTEMMTSDKSFFSLAGSWFKKDGQRRPQNPIEVKVPDLKHLDNNSELYVWFGHSAYLLQTGGNIIVVDPVFYEGSPFSFINKPFPMSYHFTPDDLPDIDLLIITHDHWDHLDYKTIRQLRSRIKKIVCPLGVGAHFERWKFNKEDIIELDWDEDTTINNLTIHCLTARHFSGRLMGNPTLWASYMIETPQRKTFISGDGGYGKHFAAIGKRFPDIDVAILENGQYNPQWANIHTLPEQLPLEINDLNPKTILTVHHSKFALSTHPYDEPIKNIQTLQNQGYHVLNPSIGEIIYFNPTQEEH
ncbi:MAG: MBL fold metallo-hydrolase [Bacteroidales bacterium]|nr:MBL fold metallo-hydrolase [Bacteroidales bacterium]